MGDLSSGVNKDKAKNRKQLFQNLEF